MSEPKVKASKTQGKRKATPGSFKPGNTLGKGRPKNADSIAVFVRTFLEEANRREAIIEHAYARAIDSEDPQSKQWADFLFNRAYGTPVSTIDLKGTLDVTNHMSNMTLEELENERKKYN